MDARNHRWSALIIVIFSFPVTIAVATEPAPGNLRTRNFVVTAPDQELASRIGFAAEQYRRELALEWLGRELPDWPQPCVITAHIKPQAFGETSFSFAGKIGRPSQPFDFVMEVNGSRERILDSVLPHEVSHTIFATHFGQPLPRWADEGACTTVEHLSERRKNHRMLIEFLTTGRGIPFNRMFAMKKYPRDILPLYAQGYSLCRYLIQRGGKRKFIKFMGDGMKDSNWPAAIATHYGVKDLSQLQVSWLDWVKKGCPEPGKGILVQTKNEHSSDTGKQGFVQETAVASLNDSTPPKQSPVSPKFVEPSSTADVQSSPSQRSQESGTSVSENFYLREIERAKSGTLLR